MIYTYTISQDGASVELTGDNDTDLREKAHRIARKSLDTGVGGVSIMRQAGKGRPRVVAVLSQKDRVAVGERWG